MSLCVCASVRPSVRVFVRPLAGKKVEYGEWKMNK